MERMEVLKNTNENTTVLGEYVKGLFNFRREEMDMRRYIGMFKERDFKLRQVFDIFTKGLSFSNIEFLDRNVKGF